MTPSAVPPAGASSGHDETVPPAKMPGALVVDDGGRPVVDDGGRPVPVDFPAADDVEAALDAALDDDLADQ